MLNTIKKIVFVVVLVCCSLPLSLSAEPPPAGVDEVLVEMEKFEKGYHAGKWQGATESIEAMRLKINEIYVQAQLDDFVLDEALDDLKKSVVAENEAEVDVAYTAFQKQYFNFVSHFDHAVHPILIKTERHVMTGAPEAFAKGDYSGTLWEMNTAGMLIDHGKAVLVNKGVAEVEINEFKSRIIALNMAGKAGDSAKMGELLDQLKELYGSFMSRYRQ